MQNSLFTNSQPMWGWHYTPPISCEFPSSLLLTKHFHNSLSFHIHFSLYHQDHLYAINSNSANWHTSEAPIQATILSVPCFYSTVIACLDLLVFEADDQVMAALLYTMVMDGGRRWCHTAGSPHNLTWPHRIAIINVCWVNSIAKSWALPTTYFNILCLCQWTHV